MTRPFTDHRRETPRGATPLDSASGSESYNAWMVGLAALGLALILAATAGPGKSVTETSGASNTQSPPLAPVQVTTIETASGPKALQPTAGEVNPVVSAFDQPVEKPEAPQAPEWSEQTVRPGDNLSLIFARAGFSDRDVYQVTRSDGGRALRKIYPGETIAFKTDESGALSAVKHVESKLRWTVFERNEGKYVAQVTQRVPELREHTSTMTITSSLFLAGQEAGLSVAVIMELANIFGGVIDFALDPRVGDSIELVFEEEWLDGAKLADGGIIAAAFTNKGTTYEAYRYTDTVGDTSFYNEQGVSMRKAFLKAPVDFTRVSSNFNPNRLHPIYKTKRPHRGTDYAAPTGTPVYAAGDGRVVKAGYTRPNGNYVFIQHGEQFKTHYLHLNKRRVKAGQRVKQGQVIGTVGSTGAATGPHLHYEFLVNGVHRNPRTVHKLLPKAKSLPDSELQRFKHQITRPLQQLASLRNTQKVALKQ